MKRICTICVRAGSKGVKNKNIRDLSGKPLIAYSILQAKHSNLFEYVAVSSDSEELLQISKQWGADYLVKRPMEMATDNAPKLPAIQHCVQEVEKLAGQVFDVMVDIDATSPLRTVADIEGAVQLLENAWVSNVITGAPARRSPYFNLVELNKDGFVRESKCLEKPIVRRQDSPKCYDMNASIYVWKREAFFQSKIIIVEDTMLYEMPEERSIDIDSELDFEMVKFLMSKQISCG
jgi:N-acylneuraminate cytidylyltransferase/CMP-N,N'-diacetyllegionaminic acid synthase|tara:strand:- start:1885 stop:2589 length:705 start_codon:yes stop_codon:yes gene_type:complete